MITAKKPLPMVQVLFRSPTFALLWSGQTVSWLGDGMYKVALGWAVLQLTGSALALGEVYVMTLLPSIVFVLVGGIVADRFPRRMILLFSDGGRGFAVALLAILGWMHVLQFWHVLVISLLFGVADAFFMPAYRAIRQQIVDPEFAQPANSLVESSSLLCRFFGPFLGALCLNSVGASSAFGIDALTFFISSFCLFFMRNLPISSSVSNDAGEGEQTTSHGLQHTVQKLFLEIREGFGYVANSAWLSVGILVAALLNVTFFGPIAVSLPKLVSTFYHSGPWLLGGLFAAEAVGSFAGTLFTGSGILVKRRGLVAYACLGVSAVGLLTLGLPLSQQMVPILPMVANLLAGFGFGLFIPLWETMLQERIPQDKFGRVASLDMLGSYALLPVGLIFVGLLSDYLGPSVIFVGGGLLSLLFVIIALCIPDIRQFS